MIRMSFGLLVEDVSRGEHGKLNLLGVMDTIYTSRHEAIAIPPFHVAATLLASAEDPRVAVIEFRLLDGDSQAVSPGRPRATVQFDQESADRPRRTLVTLPVPNLIISYPGDYQFEIRAIQPNNPEGYVAGHIPFEVVFRSNAG